MHARFKAARDLVATKRYNDARAVLASGPFTPDEIAEMQERLGITDADLERRKRAAHDRWGTRKDWVQRCAAKRDDLRSISGEEPTMRQVANALVAERDWPASQTDVMREVFAT